MEPANDVGDEPTSADTPSTPPSPTPKRLPFRTPSRSRRPDGLLEFKASPVKSPAKSHGREHRRTQSLKLPILINLPPATERALSPQKSRKRARIEEAEVDEGEGDIQQAERLLQYIHQRIFIGTASLDNFLDVLELCPSETATPYIPTTTLPGIRKAFSIVASTEQTHIRQQIQHSQVLQRLGMTENWTLLRRINPEAHNRDHLSQAHIKIGCISLYEFLEYVGGGYGDEERIRVTKVVRAWERAARRDMGIMGREGEARGRAQDYLKWAVRQVEGSDELRADGTWWDGLFGKVM